ncbi:multiple epidermal growth factor-like domains protein 6 [Saccostrea echinata]|uniref:multiple epidermal growth factor-like domains protein 6 n=1 Tax=Saccostrea echinata TaxID=191078 RepID=UPI002A82A7A6|nr:multiple epidermal growth factor-like domains protein 6 [Saccostrea echinata]
MTIRRAPGVITWENLARLIQRGVRRQRGRMAGFSLFISNNTQIQDSHLCYKDGNELPPLNFSTMCPKYGRYVFFYNERSKGVKYPDDYQVLTLLELCNVVVDGCESGIYGNNCSLKCPVKCLEHTCDIESGNCFECMAGWWGSKCQEECRDGTYGLRCRYKCGHCLNGTPCDKETGSCGTECDPGYLGDLCNKSCENGSYGQSCKYTCGHCFNGGPCDRFTGLCNTECDNGYFGEKCKQICGHCFNGAPCNWSTGMCNTGCDPGYFGENCKNTCGFCLNGTHCDGMTGKCNTVCDPGYSGERCKEECSPGMFGKNCSFYCSDHCSHQSCYNTNGSCKRGCIPGYKGNNCEDVCEPGFYGTNCSEVCSFRCLKSCNHIDGFCRCTAGWKGPPTCATECPPNFFGIDCRHLCSDHCSNNDTCNRYDGTCDGGCQEPFIGRICDHQNFTEYQEVRICIYKPLSTAWIAGMTVSLTSNLFAISIIIFEIRHCQLNAKANKRPEKYITMTDSRTLDNDNTTHQYEEIIDPTN